MKPSSTVNGIVIIDKPSGMTSHDVVNTVRRLFQTKRVGHTGTLDPDATGVLALCLGQATRLAEYLSSARKHYVTEVMFGIETDSQDVSGAVVAETDASHLAFEHIIALLPQFRGVIRQKPPMMSALHHEGKRLYELARAGITVEREAREIEIVALELTDFLPGHHPVAKLEVTCSTGTYIRTLAADLGTAAGVGATMRSLRRTWVGADARHAFTLCEAQTLESLRARSEQGTLSEVVLPSATALSSWPQAQITEEQLPRLRNGQKLSLQEIEATGRLSRRPDREGDLVALLDDQGDVVAIARLLEGWLQPIKVMLS